MKYSKEFKEEALKLSDEIGLKKAAQQLGIQYYTLSFLSQFLNLQRFFRRAIETAADVLHAHRRLLFCGFNLPNLQS